MKNEIAVWELFIEKRKAAFSSFYDSAAMESAALAGLGGRAVGVKAMGSVLGNGLTRNGRLSASDNPLSEIRFLKAFT